MTLFTLVRHGETEWNRTGLVQGTSDIPLNATGEQQAADAASALAGTAFDAVYASPLKRAMRTAEVIAHSLNLGPVTAIADLREREFGDGEGMHRDDFLAQFGGWTEPVPGAESREQLAERALAALRALSVQHPDGSVLIATHGGLIRVVLAEILGDDAALNGQRVHNASLHEVEVSAEHARVVRSPAVSVARS